MRKQWLVMLVAILASATLWGCGSGGGSGSSAVTDDAVLGSDADGNAYVSASECIGCHETISWSAEIVEDYLAGKHVIHSDHINAESGDECLQCHDPIGDGPGLEALIDPANVPAEGLAAVGCENCHGGGGEHFGVGPIPMAKPGIDECAACHATLPDNHLTYHPEANNIGTNFVESRHYTASVRNEAVCSKCHTDEGGRLYKDVTTKTQLEAIVLPVESDAPVQCRTCHNPHNAGGLLMEEVEDHGHVVASAEYATCVVCHMSDRDDPSDAEWMYHEDRYYRVITDTHYDDPATTDVVEGYVVNPLSERACRDCHDVHNVMEIRSERDTDTVNDQWSESGHAGNIGTVKKAVAAEQADLGNDRTIAQTVAIKAAGASDETSGGGFTHYDWDAGNRQSCQMCHTATGFMNYVADPENYDAADNDFSHLSGWEVDEEGTVTSSGQNELLYCWGCHSNNAGGLRVQGAVTATYTYNEMPVVFPDVGSSNTCVVCHSGRGNNETASESSRFAGHHAPAAADLFSEYSHVAYEYEGLNYGNVPYFAHDMIDADGQGPCVACHMNSEADNHTFAVVEKDEEGVITAVTADVCVGCHDGEHGLFVGAGLVGTTQNIWDGTAAVPTVVTEEMVAESAALLEEEAEGYQEAGLLIQDIINQTNGMTNYTGAVIDQNNELEDDRGAFQNAKLPTDEPGGFAHNRYYVKRALFDAIDWAVDGTIDGEIVIDDTVYPAAAHWLGADAETGVAARP